MNRRGVMTVLGGAAVTWPLTVHAQQPRMPVIGFLDLRSSGETESVVAGFREGLKDAGYVEGQNVIIEHRWAEGQFGRLPALASELVRRPVSVIFAGGNAASLAAKAATTMIPIVFISGGDPVQLGLVVSFNRPGGNATGVNLFTVTLETKKLELLHDLVPKAVMIGALVNPNNPNAGTVSKDLQVAGRALGLQLHSVNAGTEGQIDTALATIVEQRIDALLVASDPFFTNRRYQLVTLTTR